MNKTLTTSIAATTLALGLVLGTTAQAASPSAKPTLAGAKTHAVAKGKEGTATHEMSEASTGTGEEGSKKVAKSKTTKKAAKASASPAATK